MSFPALKVSVFIAKLLEHCCANTEAMSSNPVEVPTSFRVNLQQERIKGVREGIPHTHPIP